MRSISKPYRINEKIKVREVLLIDENGTNHGKMRIEDAFKMAEESNLDVVEVSPDANPPVCKILDYGKYKYQQKKREQQVKKPQIRIKEVRLRPKTGDHDIEVRLKSAQRFLEHGDKVLISIQFRGREMIHLDLGKQIMDRVAQALQEIAKVERPAKLEGRRMTMVLVGKNS